jgi:hypothetical protein
MLACMQREERAAVREMPAAFELHPELALRFRGGEARSPRRTPRPARRRYRSYWRTYQMSDHLPLWAEFRIDFSDEYLTEITAPRAVTSRRPRVSRCG